MKLAKKTLSVALAAVMAASSLAGATSVFAATNNSYLPSVASYKAVSVGTTKVTPDVKIDTKYATKDAADVTKQIDSTTLSNYYSFTPAKTGKYTLEVESTPLYHGYSKKTYDLKIASYVTFATMTQEQQEEIKKAALEDAYVWSNSYDGLYNDSAFTQEITKENCASYAKDTVSVDNVSGEDAVLTSKVTTSSTTSSTTEYELSYKYDADKNDVVVDKKAYKAADPEKTTMTDNGKSIYLTAGHTYKFVVTVANQDVLVGSKEVLDKDKKVEKVEAELTKAPASATFTIKSSEEVSYVKDYQKATDKQKVEVSYKYATGTIDPKTGKYYVEKEVYEEVVSATNSSVATSVKVADTYNNSKVTVFKNESKALQTLTLGKYVGTVTGCDDTKAPNLSSVVITNPDFVVTTGMFAKDAKITAPSNSIAYKSALAEGYKVNVACTHKWVVTKAATIFATGSKKCSECDATATIAKVKFAPTAKASKKNIVVKGNAGKVAKLAVWVYDSKGNLVKKQVKKNVTKNTVKVSKAGKYTVKVKAYGTNGAKTSSVKKTVKVK